MKPERQKYRAKGSCDVTRMPWVLDQGSVFTEEVVEAKSDASVFVRARISIAFNIGDAVGKQMVDLHNQKLEANKLLKLAMSETGV
jgi:hypothetical protein